MLQVFYTRRSSTLENAKALQSISLLSFEFSCTKKLKIKSHEFAYHGSCSDDVIG